MKKKFLFVFGFYTVLFTACSLKYEDTVQVDSRVPEFVFENTTMTRYEDNDVNKAVQKPNTNKNFFFITNELSVRLGQIANF